MKPLEAEDDLMSDSILVVRAEDGRVVESEVVEGELASVVKSIAEKVLKVWDPERSDYVIIRDKYEVSIKLPLSKEQFERFSKFDIRRTPDGYAVFDIPVYVISYENEWQGDDYVDRKVYVVSLYVDDEVRKDIEEWALESTKGKPRTFEIEISEEELRQLEEIEEE